MSSNSHIEPGFNGYQNYFGVRGSLRRKLRLISFGGIIIALIAVNVILVSAIEYNSVLVSGQYARYSVSASDSVGGDEYDSDSVNLEWVMNRIVSVVGKQVTLEVTRHLKDGTENIKSSIFSIETGEVSSPFPLLIAANLNLNNSVYVGSPWTIYYQDTVSHWDIYTNELLYQRFANFVSSFSSYIFEGNTRKEVSLEYDQATGILLRYKLFVYVQNGEFPIFVEEWNLMETNIFSPPADKANTGLEASYIYVAGAIIAVIMIVLVLAIFIRKRKLSGQDSSKPSKPAQPKATFPTEVSQSDKLFCNGCGATLSIGDKFCLNCGARVPNNPAFHKVLNENDK